MKPRSDSEIREEYQDLALDGKDELRVVRILDSGYGGVVPPRSSAPNFRPGVGNLPAPSRSPTISRRRKWILPLTGAGIAALAAGVAFALSNITNLGPPTNDVSQYPQNILSGFHRIGTPLRSHLRTEMIFIGTEDDSYSAAERWPVVKALRQFGTFSRISATVEANLKPPLMVAIPTYDWHKAIYSSRYVYFLHRDLLDRNFRPFQTLSGVAKTLYDRYSRTKGIGLKDDPYGAKNTVFGSSPTRRLPLLYVGGYVQTVTKAMNPGDLARADPSVPGEFVPLPFSDVQNALVTQQEPPASLLVEDVNTETNVITALICHADGKRPGSVCNRPVIHQLLKHVK